MGTRSNARLATIHRGAASLLVLLVVLSMGACADIWGISDRELTSSGTGGTAGTGALGGTTTTGGKGGGGTGGTMGECSTDADCVTSKVGPKCDPETKTCVECLPGPNDNCDFGLYCDATKSCFVGCASNSDCNSNGATTPLSCNTATHQCEGCDGSTKCPPGSKCVGGICSPGCDVDNPCPNSDWDCCADKCQNITKDVNNCGKCNDPCVPTDSTNWICLDGGCVFQSCNPGHADCDQNLSKGNGCEINTSTSVANCGKCNSPCTIENGTPACIGGQCAVDSCNTTYSDCNLMPDDGCESDNNTDANHCGNCSTSCAGAFANAQAMCTLGMCQFEMCNTGFANCNSTLTDGCEVNITTSLANCGSCDAPCILPNAVPKCEAGMCEVDLCDDGKGDCTAAAGCETDLTQNTAHCGMCGTVCSFANATAICNGGTCQIGTCSNGFADCDGVQNNGCEVQLGNNINNCGACGNVCNATNASNVTCNNGDCKPMCLPGFADCDGIDGNGCETDLKSNPNNCNACGVVCPANGGSPFCTNGVCGSTNCNPGTGDCNGDGMCETPLNTTNNCGACGNVCSNFHATPSCTGTPAICQLSCEMGWDNCNGNVNDGCEQTLTSNAHCGACNAVCSIPNASTSCASGQCTFVSCLPGFANCNGNLADGCEVQLATNNANCGQCGNTCSPTNGVGQCVAGQCTVQSCNNGFGNCNGSAADGCETDIYTPPHCGSCASGCTFPNAGAFCTPPNSCQMGQCNPNFLNCNGNLADGCEVNGLTVQNCGSCGNQCASVNGVAMCNGGSCQINCAPGYANCDGLFSNGCETALNTLMDCGGCGIPCVLPNATESCNTGTCEISICDPGFTNCDNFTGNGCECGTNCISGQCQGCGDGQCTGTETCTSCPNDCGSCNCGNNICDPFETCANCPGDCCCGDLTCDMATEDCMSCPADCGICSSSSSAGGSTGSGPSCGDGTCNIPIEDCLICPADCGACGSGGSSGAGGIVCGNSTCESPTEDCATCPLDCGACLCGSHPGVECDSQGTCTTGSGNGCCRLPGGNETCTVPFMCTMGSGKHYACDEKSDCAGQVCCSPLTGGATCKSTCAVGESELCFNPTMGLPSCECSGAMYQCCPPGPKNAFYPTCQPPGPCL